jgi:hypothetical protein
MGFFWMPAWIACRLAPDLTLRAARQTSIRPGTQAEWYGAGTASRRLVWSTCRQISARASAAGQ